MDEAARDTTDERPLGWLRLTVTVTVIGALPVWLILTATLAQMSPQSVVVMVDGMPEVVEVLDHVGAAWTAASWLLLVGLVTAPVAVAVGMVQRARHEADPTPGPIDDMVLPADTPWEVTRRRLDGGEEPDRAEDAPPAKPVEAPTATEADDPDPEPSSSADDEPAPNGEGRDDVDALFR